jgi:hypothetical protein
MEGGEVTSSTMKSTFELRMLQVQQGLGGVLTGESASLRRLTVAILAIQAAACFAAWFTNVMLHGDGAFFTYSLSMGEAWMLKWRDIAARATVYITTVVPTEWLAAWLQLEPLDISRLNGFIFYLVPALQFAVASALIWRSAPQYLVFPAAQYTLSTALGFGFPSEILLAPGFLWICLFLIVTNRTFGILFWISLAGLVFSHELALPAAIVTVYFAFRQLREEDGGSRRQWRPVAVLAMAIAIFALLIGVRLSGGGAGSNGNAIFVLDPRRIFNNPTLLVLGVALAATLIAARRYPQLPRNGLAVSLMVILAFALPLFLRVVFPGIDFEQGRYDSARTIIGAAMFVLALSFVVVVRAERVGANVPSQDWRENTPLALAVALAVSMGSDIAFLYDWSVALRGFERVATTASSGANVISYDEARTLMTPEETALNDRLDFQWVLPYRSIMLANGGVPARLVFDKGDYYSDYCEKSVFLRPERGVISPAARTAMREFACAYVPPPPLLTKSRRFFNYLREWRDRLFGN